MGPAHPGTGGMGQPGGPQIGVQGQPSLPGQYAPPGLQTCFACQRNKHCKAGQGQCKLYTQPSFRM